MVCAWRHALSRIVAGAVLAPRAGMRIKSILCPVDFSDCSHEALMRAVDLAKETSADLFLLHVYQLVITDGMLFVPEFLTQTQKRADDALKSLISRVDRLGVPNVKGEAMMGIPWDEIVRHARHLGTDLIVMGTHGRTGFKHALIGSVAERVVRHAPCTVMVV